MATKEKVNFTIDKEIMDKIRKMAEAQNRNLSNMIEVLLKEALSSK